MESKRTWNSFEERRLDGLRYFVGGSGPPIVLVHGLGGMASNWRLVAPELAGERRVIVPELPGHGGSAPLEGAQNIDPYADAVLAASIFHFGEYSIEEAKCNPKPMQKPHPPITIGGSGEKVMLKLVARFADRWNCPAGYESFEHKFNVLKQHCKDVGRDVNTIDVSEQLLVCIGNSDEEVEQKWKAAQMLKPFVTTGIKGTPKQLIEELRKRVAMGITTFTIFFSDFGPPPTLELFARPGGTLEADLTVTKLAGLALILSAKSLSDAPRDSRMPAIPPADWTSLDATDCALTWPSPTAAYSADRSG